jgi:hypothetical protein
MNADDPRGRDMAELARLLPIPAERELPAGRQHTLKEHLVSELRLAASPPAGRPATRRRRKPAIVIAAAGAAALAAAIVLTLLPGNTPGSSPAAARLLAKIATAAARQPSPPVRNSQFWYIKSWVAFQSCNGGSATSKCILERPHERQIWQSVSSLCVAGLLREYGQDTRLTLSPAGLMPLSPAGSTVPGSPRPRLHCPDQGGVHDPTYRFLQSLPTGPHALLSLIEREMQGQLPRPEEAFTTIGDLLREAIAPARVSAALYRAAALIPGVTVVPDATDAIGRHGVAVAMTYQGVRSEWVFSKQTLQYLGERDINTANGSTTGEAAVLQRAFVNHAGQIPG